MSATLLGCGCISLPRCCARKLRLTKWLFLERDRRDPSIGGLGSLGLLRLLRYTPQNASNRCTMGNAGLSTPRVAAVQSLAAVIVFPANTIPIPLT